jgi:hypothetical protein
MAFSLAEEAGFASQGDREIELTFSYSHRARDDHSLSLYNALATSYLGLADGWLLGLQTSATYDDTSNAEGLTWDGAGLRLNIGIRDPTDHDDGLGLALYAAVWTSETNASHDLRLVAQKLSGNYNFIYNLRLTTDVTGLDGGGLDTNAAVGHIFGFAYSLQLPLPQLSDFTLGIEADIDSEITEWSNYNRTTAYAGPTLGLAWTENWKLSLGCLVQLTDEDDLPRWSGILTLGYSY